MRSDEAQPPYSTQILDNLSDARPSAPLSSSEQLPPLPSERLMLKLNKVLEGRMPFGRQHVRSARVNVEDQNKNWLNNHRVPPMHIVVVRPGSHNSPIECDEFGHTQPGISGSLYSFYVSDKDILSFMDMSLIPREKYTLEFDVISDPNEDKYDAILSRNSRDSRYFTSRDSEQPVFSWLAETSEEPKPQVVVIAIDSNNIESNFGSQGLAYHGVFVTSFEDTEGDVDAAFGPNGLLKNTDEERREQEELARIEILEQKRQMEIERRRQKEEELARQIKETPMEYHAQLTAELESKGVLPATPYFASYSYVDSRGDTSINTKVAVSRNRDGVVRVVLDHVRINQLEEAIKTRSTPISGEEIDTYFDSRADAGRMVIEISENGSTVALERRKTGEVNYSQVRILDSAVAAHFIPKLDEIIPARPQNPERSRNKGNADETMVYSGGRNGSLADYEKAETDRKKAEKLRLETVVADAQRLFDSAKQMGWSSDITRAQERLTAATQALEDFNHSKQEPARDGSTSQSPRRSGKKVPYSRRRGQ